MCNFLNIYRKQIKAREVFMKVIAKNAKHIKMVYALCFDHNKFYIDSFLIYNVFSTLICTNLTLYER